MPDHTPAEKEKNRRNKSADAIDAFDAAEQGPRKKKKKKKAAAPEKASSGRDDSEANFQRLSAGLRQQIEAAKGSGNDALAQRLAARLVELRKITDAAN